MDKLAIIGTGYMACIIAKRANELGIETHCFSNDEHSVAAVVANYYHNINILDVEKLTEYCRDIGINGIVATTELTIWPTNYVANKLGLNGNEVEFSKKITDKIYVREKTKNVVGLSKPYYWICYDKESLPVIERYPVIVKPISAGGKRGISVIFEQQKIQKAVEEAINVSKLKGALIEEFLTGGQEYSVESLSYNGNHHILQFTQKDSSGAPHCVELGHHQPADLSIELRLRAEKVIGDCLTAVGMKNGPCHTEIKIIDGRIYLIEINARPGGDHIAYPLTELSTGYPYISGIIWTALDRLDEKAFQKLEKNYCGVYFVTTQTAYLKEIFEHCDGEPWLYRKNLVSKELKPIIHNDGFNTNYFIYFSRDKKPDLKIQEVNR